MAEKRSSSLTRLGTRGRAAGLSVWVILVLMFGGCAQVPVVEELPSANFNGPLVAQVAPAPAPAPVKVAPKPVEVKAPQLAAIPREWTPTASKQGGWRWIVIHHSATPGGGARAFDKMHKAKGWDELGYHFVIGNGTDTGDGQVEVGPRWPRQKWGAHAKTPDNRFNNYGIGICLVGNFDNERPTRAQMQSLSRLVAHLMKTYRIPADRVLGHGETKATDCPGRHLSIADVKRQATALAGMDDAPERVAASAEMLKDLGHK
jgi:hypothetical protein